MTAATTSPLVDRRGEAPSAPADGVGDGNLVALIVE